MDYAFKYEIDAQIPFHNNDNIDKSKISDDTSERNLINEENFPQVIEMSNIY